MTQPNYTGRLFLKTFLTPHAQIQENRIVEIFFTKNNLLTKKGIKIWCKRGVLYEDETMEKLIYACFGFALSRFL